MEAERWLRVKELFEAAVERDRGHREAFLDQACSGDQELRREVETLLAGHDDDEFLNRPVYEAVPELFEDDPGNSLVGSRLGPYVFKSKLGQGGMGVVYLAEDTKLDRTVAIKALAPASTRNEQYRERLRREARAAAKLIHPGIATVFALEEFGDNLYLVREYVRGRTLFEQMKEGPLPLPRLLDSAVKTVQALAAAHDAGVVHRDLKPENIVAAEDGGIKILDFGLARIVKPETAETLSLLRLTAAGMVIGTPAYSSPEQLLGNEVDFRSDQFSLGVMLFELASGVHPFAASDPISVIARILESEPAEFSSLGKEVPAELERIIRRCIRKDPAQRYAATRELLADLEMLRAKTSGAQPAVPDGSAVAPAAEPEGPAAKRSALWWWQFHQACVATVYYLMLIPLWILKQWTPGFAGSLIFFPALVAVGVAANLRYHLWFTSACYPEQLSWYRRRVAPWVRTADVIFVTDLFASALVMHSLHAVIATLLLTAAIGSLVAFLLIEPTTTRAALKETGGPLP